jgi:hypothetical protein
VDIICFGLFFLFFAVILIRELRARNWGEAIDLTALLGLLAVICVVAK